MLTHLHIQNLALVDKLTWELGSGLVGVTGETGAGKSVIVGALKLVLGERADKSLIRTGETTCSVQAMFELNSPDTINAILEESGIDACEDKQLIIKRVIGQSSNKQYINNTPATLGVLKKLGEHLVDLHGPHDHQSLLSVERQLTMLDAYAGVEKQRVAYAESWAKWRESVNAYEALRSAAQASAQELDLLRFQVEEIEAADLVADEEKEIEERYQRTSNGSRLVEVSSEIAGILGNQISQPLGDVQRLSRELERLDPAVRSLLEGIDGAVMELQELERELANYASELDIDPAEAQALEDRINTFETLKRKHGPTLQDVIDHGVSARERLDGVENRGDKLDELEAVMKQNRETLIEVGRKLSDKRRKVAPKLGKVIVKHIQELGFKQAAFEVQLHAQDEPNSSGLETVEFLFGPNPGEPMKPLRSIASSGEISRVMLSVKSALADQDATPLMVFDEIDANVGGEIARAVGEKMAALGEKHQVVSITHFPQVAAVAKQHFVVEKLVEDGRTHSRLRPVQDEERIDELVRMLGGGDGEQARAMAESLLVIG